MQMLKIKDGRFVKDIEFGIIPKEIKEKCYAYKANTMIVQEEIPNIDLDISDISPSILLACINNSYATGFSSCVGYDETLESFSTNISKYYKTIMLRPFKKLLSKYDQTGIINTKEWNIIALQLGYIWTDTVNGSIIATDTIEEIVKTARSLHSKYKKHENSQDPH
jgi:hypothetical protein